MISRSGFMGEHGYALFDALIGLALAAIVLATASTTLTQFSALRARFASDYSFRDQESAVRLALTRHIEQSADHKLSALAPSADERQFTIVHFDRSGAQQQTSFVIETNASNQKILMISKPGPNALPVKESVLGPARVIAFSYRIIGEAGVAYTANESQDRTKLIEVRLSLQWSAESSPTIMTFAVPQYARTICIAQPFLRDCYS